MKLIFRIGEKLLVFSHVRERASLNNYLFLRIRRRVTANPLIALALRERLFITKTKCLRVRPSKASKVESNGKITGRARKRKRAPLMAIASEKRLRGKYCTIVIPSHPCQLVQPFVSRLARTLLREIFEHPVLETKGHAPPSAKQCR